MSPKIMEEIVRKISGHEKRLEYLETLEAPVVPREGCRVYNGSNQWVGQNNFVTLSFSAADWNIGPCWSSDQAQRLVAPVKGYYGCEVQVLWADDSNQDGYRQIRIIDQGGNMIVTPDIKVYQAGDFTSQRVGVRFWYMEEGDYLRIQAWQNSSGITKRIIPRESTANQAGNHAAFWRVA